MKCNEVRQNWSIHYDAEGDARLQCQVEEHLAACPVCSEWYKKQNRFEDLLRERLCAPARDSRLWSRVLGGVGVAKPVRSRRRVLAALAASITPVAIILAWAGNRSRDRNSHDLIVLASDWHNRLVTGAVQPEFSSRSDLAVEGFLRGQVSFPVRCPPRKDSGFEVRGAGTCRLANEAAAYVAGMVDATPVSIFVMRSESLAAYEVPKPQTEREFVRSRAGRNEVILSVIDRNAVVVVGHAAQRSLERVISAYGTYPDAP